METEKERNILQRFELFNKILQDLGKIENADVYVHDIESNVHQMTFTIKLR